MSWVHFCLMIVSWNDQYLWARLFFLTWRSSLQKCAEHSKSVPRMCPPSISACRPSISACRASIFGMPSPQSQAEFGTTIIILQWAWVNPVSPTTKIPSTWENKSQGQLMCICKRPVKAALAFQLLILQKDQLFSKIELLCSTGASSHIVFLRWLIYPYSICIYQVPISYDQYHSAQYSDVLIFLALNFILSQFSNFLHTNWSFLYFSEIEFDDKKAS